MFKSVAETYFHENNIVNVSLTLCNKKTVFFRFYMAEILMIWRETQFNQSIQYKNVYLEMFCICFYY